MGKVRIHLSGKFEGRRRRQIFLFFNERNFDKEKIFSFMEISALITVSAGPTYHPGPAETMINAEISIGGLNVPEPGQNRFHPVGIPHRNRPPFRREQAPVAGAAESVVD